MANNIFEQQIEEPGRYFYLQELELFTNLCLKARAKAIKE